ncbi:4Fe-4S dicluster domain-containing protein [Shinella sumterensis]|uniref:4Fe-4S dicluster domain-containing protein n=1 Tax=Shinella sumterensis TaxID=1967501 RepID=UPI00106E0C78|nr:4Fe-4S dicluster domain-containing protein [Shinella sumterensis]MCD1263621.1 ferredoxin [Shinella sumterensis]TFE97959.1 ferredoxin [Shinella sumterensis]WLS08042.1 4Fe-4S dicluster domain-containing protein [Shinella sumterensis]
MNASGHHLETIRAALQPHGLFLRGVVNFADGEAAPTLSNSRPAASVVLIGNIGSSLWPAFSRWRRSRADAGGPDPLDTWSKDVIGPIAAMAGATAWFPSDPPWQPFQQWAMRAEGLKASPLGILIHPVYGLWHGYRGALGFAVPAVTEPVARPVEHPCDACRDRPCLTTCPAAAVRADAFDVPACRSHLRTPQGQGGCLRGGCLARAACPVGAAYRYGDDQLRFHMAALSL